MFCSEYIVYCVNKTDVEAANGSRHMVRFNCIEESQKFLFRLSKLKLKIKSTPKNDINSLQISEFQNKDHFTEFFLRTKWYKNAYPIYIELEQIFHKQNQCIHVQLLKSDHLYANEITCNNKAS